MPANYPFPPQFLRLPDSTEYYAKGIALGSQMQMEREKLQAQRDAAAMAAQVRAQEMAAENARAAQRLEIEKAYKDSVLNLQEQELRRKQAEDEIQMAQAAQKFALQQEWNRGPRPGESWATFALRVGPAMTGSLAGTSELWREAYGTPFTPKMVTIPSDTPGVGTTMIQTAPDRWIPAPQEPEEGKSVTIDGVKYLRTRGAGGQYDYQQVKEPDKAQQLVNGGIPAVHIWQAGTTNVPVRGMQGVPTAGGGYTTRSTPLGAATLLDKQLARMEEEYGADILRGDREPRAAQAKRIGAQLPALRQQYKELRDALQQALQPFIGQGGGTELPPESSWPTDKNGRVLVTSPSGVKGDLPKEQVRDAVLTKGFKIGWK